MKRFKLLYALLLTVVAALGGLLIACNGNTSTPSVKEGPESGVYYYDVDDDEYLITLGKGAVATFVATETNDVGEYSISGSKLSLKFDTVTYNATLNGDTLAVDMGDGRGVWNFTKRIPYTVSFDSGEGSAVSPVRVINGKLITKKPSDPVNGDMVFIGWYTDKEYTKPFVFEADPVKSDMTLYARWVEPVFGKNEFDVEFDLGYEGAPAVAAKQTVGGRLYDVVTPTREGYSFEGWWVKLYNADRTAKEYSYRVTADTVLAANTTLYALWQPVGGSKLASPVVDVTSNGISWGSNANARAYAVLVTGPDGSEVRNDDGYGPTSMDIAFSTMAEGRYIISVTAVAASGNTSDNSEPAIRYYDNKALAPVSMFTVVEPSTLIYNAVEGAEKYLLDIKCGDEYHDHSQIDNGKSTSFNFINCMMKSTGIEFTVTAVADGRASSVSEMYCYTRPLGDVTGLRYSRAEEMVAWNAVKGAEGYTVELSCENGEHSHNVTIDVGNTTSMSVKTFEACNGKITVKVTPYTKGYNSPAPAEIAIDKTTLAAPSDVRIVGDVLSWAGDAAATGYDVYIAGQTASSATNSLDLSELVGINWEKNGDYQIRVRAKNSNSASLWSDTVDARYYALYSSLTYNAGVVSWRHVIGAVKYNVRVNDGNAREVNDGTNSFAVTLTQAGENVVYVNFVDGDNKASGWAEITVYAEQVTFDLRGGEGDVYAQYYAMGDRVRLPDGEELNKPGYQFAGWYTTPYGAEGMGARYTDEYYGTVGGLILYANWTPRTYEIKFDYNGGVVGEETGSVVYNKDYKWPIPTPGDTATVFVGWFSDRNGREVQYTDEQGNSKSKWVLPRDMTVYACWSSIFSFTKLSNGTYRIAKHPTYFTSNAPEDITIPATYQAYDDSRPVNVTEIGSSSFTSSNILKIVRIPASIKYVDSNAFSGSNNIEQFIVYDVEGTKAPEYSSHEGVLYHDVINDFGVVTAKELWLYPRAKTGDYDIPSGVTTLRAKSLQYAKADKITVPSTVTVIEMNAFYYSSASEITFEFAGNVNVDNGGNVSPLTIYSEAFYNCSSLKKVVFPARLTNFNPAIFKTCNQFEEIEMEPASTTYSDVDGFLCNASKTTLIYCPPAAISATPGIFTVPVGINTIGARAFADNTKIKELVFPFWTSKIEAYSFSGCTNLEKITFEGDALEGFKIEEYAFEKCTKLKNIIFDSGSMLVEIGNYAFTGCYTIANIELPETLETIGDYAFNGCYNITAIAFPKNLTTIGTYAFSGCTKLSDISFAEDGTNITIENYAFNGCTSMTEIEIPVSVTKIGDGVFAGCTKLSSITVAPGNEKYETWEGVLFSKGYEEILYYPLGKTGNFTLPEAVKRISDSLFKNITSMESISISKNVEYIGREAFYGCTGLTAVYFDQGDGEELELGESAFHGCTKLEIAELPDRVKVIPAGLFYNDQVLETIRIPAYLTEIEYDAFYYCYAIRSVTIPATVSKIGYRAFYYCKALETVEFLNAPEPDEAETVGDGDEDEIEYATELEFNLIPSTTANTNAYVFYYCGALTSINLPARATEIPNGFLYNCSSLESITIPNTISYIGSRAFYGCYKLETVDFEGGNLTNTLTMGDSGFAASTSSGVFSGCSALQNINLPARIKNIPAYTFYNCKALKEIVLPTSLSNVNTVSAISDNVFYNCTALETVTFADGNTNPVTIGDYAFRGCSALTTLNLPKNLKSANANDAYGVFNGTNVFSGCVALSTVNVEDNDDITGNYYSVDGILYYAATDEDGVTVNELVFCPSARTKDVTVPYYVTTIGYHAFNGCSSIESIAFDAAPEGETEVELTVTDGCVVSNVIYGAFKNNSGLTAIDLPDRLVHIGSYAFYGCTNIASVDLDATSKLKVINDNAFYECYSLTEIFIPKAVTKIGNYAFNRCMLLRSVRFAEDSVMKSIGNNAFAVTVFTSIKIPDTVTTLGSNVFNGSQLSTIKLPSSLTEIGATFNGCSNLSVITLDNDNCASFYVDDSVIYNKAKTVLYFYPVGKTATTFEILDTVQTITEYAFSGNYNLQTVIIPISVTEIGTGAFSNCGDLTTVTFRQDTATSALTSLNVGDSDDTVGVFENSYSLANVAFPSRLTILGSRAFYGCENLNGDGMFDAVTGLQAINANVFTAAGKGTLVLPSSVSAIAAEAFRTSTFGEIDLSQTRTIGTNAFRGSAITRLTVPSSVAEIGSAAFAECVELTELTILLNRTSNLTMTTTTTTGTTGRPYGTFYNCSNLRTATIATNGNLPYWMLFGCHKLETLTVTGNATIDGYLCYETVGLKRVSIAKSVKKIGNYAFYHCSNLGSHVEDTCVDPDCIGNNAHGFYFTGSMNYELSEFGTYALCGTAITSFTVPNSLKTTGLGAYVFLNCKSLTSVSLPADAITSIGTQVFYGCTALEDVTFTGVANRNLTTIGSSTFKDCVSLKSFDFTGITSIGGNAFENAGLTSVRLPDTLTTLSSTAFKNTAVVSVTIPTKAFTTIASSSFINCLNLETVTFTDTGSHATNRLTTIGVSAFADCPKLKKIVLPDTVTTISATAFKGSGLQSITFGASVATIDPTAFVGVNNVSAMTVATGNTNFKLSADNKALLTYDGKTLVKCFTSEDDYTVPAGVETIATNAFAGSNVVNVTLQSGVTTINASAFLGCEKLESVVIPNSVTTIGQEAFSGCVALDNVVLPAKLTSVGVKAFLNCKGLVNLTFTPADGDDGLTTIGDYAFSGCSNLNSFTFPDTLTKIGQGAFAGCESITDLTIPSSVATINIAAFAGCSSLANLTFEEGGVLRIIAGTKDVATSEISDPRGAFADCTSLETIDLSPRTYVYFNASATSASYNGASDFLCCGCSSLKSFKLPDTAVTIGKAAFMNCTSLESLTVPSNIVVLGTASFAGCLLLERVIIEETEDTADALRILAGSTTAGEYNRGAFADCVSLKAIDLSTRANLYNNATLTNTADTYKALAGFTFSGCTSLQSVVLPSNIITIGQAAFMDCGLTSLTIPSHVLVITYAAFAGCQDLASVVIEETNDARDALRITQGSSTLTYNRGAFADCASLTSIDFSSRANLYNNSTLSAVADTYKVLPNYTFAGCTNLRTVVLPSNIITIGTAAFMDCGLTSLTIPSHVFVINAAAFAGCQDLESVILEPTADAKDAIRILAGSSTTTPGSRGAFADCTSLKSIDFSARANLYNAAGLATVNDASKVIGNYTFNGCTSLETVVLPSNILQVGSYSFQNCTSLESVTGLTGITKINDYSFQNCTSLTEFEFPVGLTNIYAFSFQNSGLTSVVLPYTLLSLGNYTFEGCPDLESVIFENDEYGKSAMGWMGAGYSGDGQYMTDTKGHTFGNLPKLKTLVLPNSPDLKIGDGSFVYTGLEEVYIPGATMQLGQYCFSYNPYLKKVTMSSETSAYIRGFAHNPALEEFVIEGTDTALNYVGTRAFEGCTSLKHFDIPSHFTAVDQYSFMNSGLESITIPDNFLVYGHIFLGCKNLKEVTFLGSINNLGSHVFDGCISLERVTMPYNYAGVTAYTFQNCTNLKEVILPDVVRTIGDYSFAGCTALKSITLPEAVSYIGQYAFYGSGVEEIVISGKDLTIDSYAFAESALKRFVMTDGEDEDGNVVTGSLGINDYAFYNCKALEVVTLPGHLVGINDFAFAGCTALTQIVLPETTDAMGNYVFDGWTADQTIYIVGLATAPESWAQYWNYDSKLIEVIPEPDEGDDDNAAPVEPVYEIRPDKVIDANVVWEYGVAPTEPTE